MIHRDLKPSNILRDGAQFKLGDFGLVTDALVKGYASRQGYTEHLAPETFDVGVTSSSTDVWAMGMTTFRLLNGEPWYEEMLEEFGVDRADPAAAAATMEDLVTSGRFTARLHWMPHVPSAWRRFVNKALSFNSATRYHDGGAMLSGMSSLHVPSGPSWDCDYRTISVVWRRDRGDRQEVVEWLRHSERRHEFKALTRPRSGSGRTLTLESSGGIVSRSRALAGLQDFFKTRTE